MSLDADKATRGQRGQTLLETAIVLPFILGVVLAAVDINSYLRTKSALQEGLTTALRCAYPADGDCVQAAAGPGEAFFDVDQVTYTTEAGRDMYTFNFRQDFLAGPELEVESFNAQTIGDGSLNYDYYQNEVRELRQNATGSINSRDIAVARSFVPYVTGGSPLNPANSTLSYKGGGGAYPEANINILFERANPVSISPSGSYTESGWTTVVRFDAPPLPAALQDSNNPGSILFGSNCQLDQSVADRNDNINAPVQASGNNCLGRTLRNDLLPQFSSLPNSDPNHYQVPGVFFLQGLRAGSSTNGITQVRIVENGTGRIANFGGRAYGASDSNASFYPRGARRVGQERYYAQVPQGGSDPAEPQEFAQGYNNGMKIKYGRRYRVQVNVTSSGTGTFEWELAANNGFRLYVPQYTTHTEQSPGVSGDCENASGSPISYRPSEIAAYPSAAIPTCHFTRQGQQYAADTLAINGAAYAVGGDIAINDTPNQLSGAVPSSLLSQSAATAGVSTQSIDWSLQSSSHSGNLQHSYSCGANNGLMGLYDQSSVSGTLSNPLVAQIASSFCPTPSPQSLGITTAEASAAAFINSYSYDVLTATYPIPEAERVQWGQEQCGATGLPAGFQAPASATAYPSHQINPPVQYSSHGHHIYNTGGQDPFELVSHDPMYNCGDYIAQNGVNGPTQEQKDLLASLSSPLAVAHIGEYCPEQLIGSVGDSARAEFISALGLEAGSYLAIGETFERTQGFPQGVPEYDALCSDDEAKILGEVVSTSYLGRFLESELPPHPCENVNVNCSYSFAGVENAGEAGDPTFDLAKAESVYGRGEVEAFNPRAKFRCEGPDCFDIQLSQPDANGLINGTATAKVKLLTLGGQTVPVAVTARERLEASLLK